MSTIIVTGASAGIGRAVAEAFHAAGWQVGLIARREDVLQSMVRSMGTNAIALPADVTGAASIDQAFNQFIVHFGRVDCLFNNAGIFTDAAPIDEIPLADWDRAVAVNLTGMFICARAAFAQMRRQINPGGRIINNGSVSAHAPREGATPYTVTKHGVTGLTKQLALDGRPHNIACGQIDIGNAQTELLQGIANAALAEGKVPPPSFDVQHVAEAVLAMANLPLHANTLFQTIMATQMPYVGRG